MLSFSITSEIDRVLKLQMPLLPRYLLEESVHVHKNSLILRTRDILHYNQEWK